MEGAHWSAPNSFGGRAFFRAERNISYLLITNVTAEGRKLLIVDPKTRYHLSHPHNQLWQKQFMSVESSINVLFIWLFIFRTRGCIAAELITGIRLREM